MQIISSYGVELRNRIFQSARHWRFTVLLSAIWSKCMNLYGKNWSKLRKVRNVSMQRNIWCIQRNGIRPGLILISAFPRLPSYFRRAAVQHALGSVSSYRTRLEQWKAEGQKTGKPYLKSEQYAMPVFYHDVMYRENTEEKDAPF